MDCAIKEIRARQVLDSRGFPTVECEVLLVSGHKGLAIVPSGASTGQAEAHELRDGDDTRYFGKGVLEAVRGVIKKISPAVSGIYASEQAELDRVLIELDGTENKTKLGSTPPPNALIVICNNPEKSITCKILTWNYITYCLIFLLKYISHESRECLFYCLGQCLIQGRSLVNN